MKLSMRLFWKRGIAYVELDNGQRRSLKTKDKAVANRLYAQIKKNALAGKLAHLTGVCTKTLETYSDEFLKWSEQVQPHATFRANKLALSKLVYFAGGKTTLDRVSKRHLDQIVAQSRTDKLSTASINNYIRHARASLNKAVEWGYLPSNPLSGAKELSATKTPPRFLDRHAVTKFIASIADIDLRRIVVAYLATGRRRTELLNLQWDDVDLENGRYLVRASKNHLSRWYPINGMFRAVLVASASASAGGERMKGRIFGKWSHPDTISHYVKKALIASGCGDMHLHHLRHTFASLQVMQGKSLMEVRELLGHTEMKTTLIYSHLSEEHIREAAEINLGPVDLGD